MKNVSSTYSSEPPPVPPAAGPAQTVQARQARGERGGGEQAQHAERHARGVQGAAEVALLAPAVLQPEPLEEGPDAPPGVEHAGEEAGLLHAAP